MDSHFHAYKAKYEILDEHLKLIGRSQYIPSMDIFINLDDVIHNMHRPLVEKEVQACSINAAKQACVHIINLIAHYKHWACKNRIQCRVFGTYTSQRDHFKNGVYIPSYRDYFSVITDPHNQRYYFVNDAIGKALPIAQNITDYVSNVFLIDSHYLEPSIIPQLLTSTGIADYKWKMVVSRDMYDLQYAYRDRWIFVSPKGENTRIITRADLWRYIAGRERITEERRNMAYYNHDLFPLALAVAGNKLRSIPRLRRIGWRTIFKYLDSITESETLSIQILSSRFHDLLGSKGVELSQIQNNLACVSVPSQVDVLNDIDKTSITSQLKYVTDHEALGTINEMYFQQFPISIPFLIDDYATGHAFFY